MNSSLKKAFKDPLRVCKYLLSHYCPQLIRNDELYLKVCYFLATRRILHFDNPRTYTEKLQWLKLHDHQPEYSKMVDKYEVKNYIKGKFGGDYLIPTYGVWSHFEDIDFKQLPDAFVLKCTHDSGGLIICEDKSKVDWEKAKKKLTRSLHHHFYWEGREFPYKNVKPRIIAEKLMRQEDGSSLRDYKVLCFNGKAKLIEYHSNRYTLHHTQDFYDTDWNKTGISQGGRDTVSDFVVARPNCLDKMIEMSEDIAQDMAHCRVDWYIIGGKMYFSEITFFDSSGFDPMDRKEDELMLGEWIDLNLVKKNNH